jgi:hypothetical protein
LTKLLESLTYRRRSRSSDIPLAQTRRYRRNLRIHSRRALNCDPHFSAMSPAPQTPPRGRRW